MKKSDDKDLQYLFKELSDHAKKTAPSFASIWEKAEVARAERRRRSLRIRLTAAATITVLLASIFLMPDGEKGMSPTTSTDLAIADWKSPTDVLLQLPSIRLEQSHPFPTDVLLEYSKSSDVE